MKAKRGKDRRNRGPGFCIDHGPGSGRGDRAASRSNHLLAANFNPLAAHYSQVPAACAIDRGQPVRPDKRGKTFDRPDEPRRLAYAAVANAFAALPLLAGIVAVGNARALSEAIDPTLGKESRAMLINGRVVDNTLQQYVLFCAASLALSVNLDPAQLHVIAAAAIVFVAARILFWIGYRIDPLYRAFGMAATIYLNLGLLIAAFWLAIY